MAQQLECIDDSSCRLRLICVKNATWQGFPDKYQSTSRCECYQKHGWDGVDCNNTTAPSFLFQMFLRLLLLFIYIYAMYRIARSTYLLLLKTDEHSQRRLYSLYPIIACLCTALPLLSVSAILTIEDSFFPERYKLVEGYKLPINVVPATSLFCLGLVVIYLCVSFLFIFIYGEYLHIYSYIHTFMVLSLNLSVSWIQLGRSLSPAFSNDSRSKYLIIFVRLSQLALTIVLFYFAAQLNFGNVVFGTAPFLIILIGLYTCGSGMIKNLFQTHVLSSEVPLPEETKKKVSKMVDKISSTASRLILGISLVVIGGIGTLIPYASNVPNANKRSDSAVGGWQRINSWSELMVSFGIAYCCFVAVRFCEFAIDGVREGQSKSSQSSRQKQVSQPRDFSGESGVGISSMSTPGGGNKDDNNHAVVENQIGTMVEGEETSVNERDGMDIYGSRVEVSYVHNADMDRNKKQRSFFRVLFPSRKRGDAKVSKESEMTTVHSVVTIDKTSSPQLFISEKGWKNVNDNWIKVDNNGVPYYFNVVSKETSWDLPPNAVIEE